MSTVSGRNAVFYNATPTPPEKTRPAFSMHWTASLSPSLGDSGKRLRRGWEHRSTAKRSFPAGESGSGGGGGGGGSTRGVRVGLGLLMMGDVARAYVSPLNHPQTLLSAPSGFQQGGFCRLQGEGARRRKSTDYDSCSSAAFVDCAVAMRLSGVSEENEGGVFLDGRKGMHRRWRRGTSVFALSYDKQKYQQQKQHDFPLPSPSTESSWPLPLLLSLPLPPPKTPWPRRLLQGQEQPRPGERLPLRRRH